MSEFNDKIVAEFRANDGRVGGPFAGVFLLLLTTTGAKSGRTRVSPVRYFVDSGTTYVIASKGGAPESPGWYHNLLVNPDVSVEQATADGVLRFEATAQPITGQAREDLFNRFAEQAPAFAEYRSKTDRLIPVVAIRRKVR